MCNVYTWYTGKTKHKSILCQQTMSHRHYMYLYSITIMKRGGNVDSFFIESSVLCVQSKVTSTFTWVVVSLLFIPKIRKIKLYLSNLSNDCWLGFVEGEHHECESLSSSNFWLCFKRAFLIRKSSIIYK